MSVSISALRVAARYQVAREFPSDKALKEYLREHPQADRSKHTVSEGKEETKEEKKPSLKERLSRVLKSVPEAAKKFVQDENYRRQKCQDLSAAIEKAPEAVVKNVIRHIKRDAEQFKLAAHGVKAVIKGEKMTPEQKKAVITVARNLAIEITIATLTGGIGGLAGRSAMSFAKSIATKIAYNAVTGEFGDILSDFDYAKDLTSGVFKVIIGKKNPDPAEVIAYAVAAKVAKELKRFSTEDMLAALEENT